MVDQAVAALILPSNSIELAGAFGNRVAAWPAKLARLAATELAEEDKGAEEPDAAERCGVRSVPIEASPK